MRSGVYQGSGVTDTLYSQYPIVVDTILNIRPEWCTPVGYTVPCENSAHFGRFSSYHVDSISFGYGMMIQYRRAAARVRCDQLRWFVIVDISGRNFRRFSLGKRGHMTTARTGSGQQQDGACCLPGE